MKIRALLLLVAAAGLTACGADAPKCSPVSLAQSGTAGDTIILTNGLRYTQTTAGAGTAAAWCKGVTITYDAFLADGTPWDTSAGLENGQYSFVPGMDQVLIAGLEQGTVGMKPGEQRHLIVPPSLGFGNNLIRFNGKTLIPPNSTLIYDVTVVSVVP